MVKDVIHDKLPLQKKLQKQTLKHGCRFSVEKRIHKKLNVVFAWSAKFLGIILISSNLLNKKSANFAFERNWLFLLNNVLIILASLMC